MVSHPEINPNSNILFRHHQPFIMKLRHKETGEIIDLPDFLPEENDAREIARIFSEAIAPDTEKHIPPGIRKLKTYTGDIISVEKFTRTVPNFPYDKLIRIHLNLPPFTNMEPDRKSDIWSVLVNGIEWTVGSRIHGMTIEELKWNPQSGWWALTDGVYAVRLEKVISSEQTKVVEMGKRSWYKKMIAN
jgi:hypothetical protein